MCHSQVRTLRPAIRNRGGSSGRTAPSAELGSDWWRDAKALTEPEKCAGRKRQRESGEAGTCEGRSAPFMVKQSEKSSHGTSPHQLFNCWWILTLSLLISTFRLAFIKHFSSLLTTQSTL